MNYLIYSMSGYYIDIRQDVDGVKHPFIEIDEKTTGEIVKALSKGLTVKVINGEVNYLINENKKRDNIVSERDRILSYVIPYTTCEWYREKELPNITTEELEDLKELYYRLLDMPQHYDNSVDKQNWSWKWVDEYTSGKNTNNYQLKILPFIKW